MRPRPLELGLQLLEVTVPPPRPATRRKWSIRPISPHLRPSTTASSSPASPEFFPFRSSQSAPSIELLDAKGDTKRVVAEVQIQAPLETVWDVLTVGIDIDRRALAHRSPRALTLSLALRASLARQDYESLPSIVPNLDKCEVLSRQGSRVRVRQVGCSQSLLWRIAAQAELEIEEVKKSGLRREVRFRSVKGDFERFEGSWVLESDVSSLARATTFLRYEIRVKVVRDLPSQIVSYVIKAGLPANIRAIAAVAERRAANRLKAPVVSLEGEEDAIGFDGVVRAGDEGDSGYDGDGGDESLPRKGPFWSLRGSRYREAAPITAALQASQRGVGTPRNARSASSAAASASVLSATDYLGTTFVPLPPSAPPTSATTTTRTRTTAAASVPNASASTSTSASAPTTPAPTTTKSNLQNMSIAEIPMPSSNSNAIEVHLRRLDGLDYIHRRVVAAIRVNAPASVVWDVITDYNRLHRFIPALVASERIQLPQNAPNVKRVRQVATKNLGYLCLHAESVMDLVERPCSELQFRQVAGDLDVIQGKIAMTEGQSTDEDYVGTSTDLKYAVEIILPAGTPAISVIEPLLEGVFFEDLPYNLLAVKAEIERVAWSTGTSASAVNNNGSANANNTDNTNTNQTNNNKPRLGDMMKDFLLLRAELVSSYGDTMTIPTRNELRAAGRSDLEKCIAAHGGASVVAARLGWTTSSKARKPKGYWYALCGGRGGRGGRGDDTLRTTLPTMNLTGPLRPLSPFLQRQELARQPQA